MIRCENCGHKLRDGQKICDICKKPVQRQNMEDVELEKQLAKSIAQIVENETADAEVYLKQIQNTLDKNGQKNENRDFASSSQRGNRNNNGYVNNTGNKSNIGSGNGGNRNNGSGNGSNGGNRNRTSDIGRNTTSGSGRPTSGGYGGNNTRQNAQSRGKSKKRKKNRGARIAVCIMLFLVVGCSIFALAYYTINTVFSKAQDNFAYYNNTGIEYVQKGEYSQAIPYLEKALTYEESSGRVNLRFSLYDCYANVGNTEKAISMLYNILNIEPYNFEAIVNLEKYYEEAGVTEALTELYRKYKDTPASVAVSKYYVEPPKLSVDGGKYSADISVIITSNYAFDIYYTTDGSDPTIGSKKYAQEINVKEGNTIIKCIAVNSYNIVSDVISAEYTIEYEAPKPPTISPASGSYETEQLIVIGNIPAGGTAYYTFDNTTPNKRSTQYDGPFDMPEGNNVLSVIVYDKNGLVSKVTKRNYVLTRKERISQEEALNISWDTMIEKNMVDENHVGVEDGAPVNLVFDTKRTVGDCTLWTFDIIVSTEQGDMKANYQMGVDTETSYVYFVRENNGIYSLDPVLY